MKLKIPPFPLRLLHGYRLPTLKAGDALSFDNAVCVNCGTFLKDGDKPCTASHDSWHAYLLARHIVSHIPNLSNHVREKLKRRLKKLIASEWRSRDLFRRHVPVEVRPSLLI